MSSEKWVDIAGHEGAYQVSSYGRVRSLDREVVDRNGKPRNRRGQLLKPGICGKGTGKKGYLHVALGYSDRNNMVHRLVAKAFLGDRSDEGLVVCHTDGDSFNNHVDNLRWDTTSENIRDQTRHGRHPRANKTHCPQGHEMIEANLVPTLSHRKCLACKRARGFFYTRGVKPSRDAFVITADRYYEVILRGVNAAA